MSFFSIAFSIVITLPTIAIAKVIALNLFALFLYQFYTLVNISKKLSLFLAFIADLPFGIARDSWKSDYYRKSNREKIP